MRAKTRTASGGSTNIISLWKVINNLVKMTNLLDKRFSDFTVDEFSVQKISAMLIEFFPLSTLLAAHSSHDEHLWKYYWNSLFKSHFVFQHQSTNVSKSFLEFSGCWSSEVEKRFRLDKNGFDRSLDAWQYFKGTTKHLWWSSSVVVCSD